MEFEVSQVLLAVVAESLCGEFNLFRKRKVGAALEALREKLNFG